MGWGEVSVALYVPFNHFLSDSGHFCWHWNPVVHGFIFGSVESDTGVDPGFLDS